MLSWEGGLHTLSPLLLCSEQERTEALLSSGVSLLLETNCPFIFAEPGSDSHSRVYEAASGSLLSMGNRRTPEAIIRSSGLSGPTLPPIAVALSRCAHSPPQPLSMPLLFPCQAWVLATSSSWNVFSVPLWGNPYSTFKAQFKSHFLCEAFYDGAFPYVPIVGTARITQNRNSHVYHFSTRP